MFSVGDKVSILWEKTEYVGSSYKLYGTILARSEEYRRGEWVVGKFDVKDKNFTLSFKENELELISKQKPWDSFIIYDLKTDIQRRKVQEKLFRMGYKWMSGCEDVQLAEQLSTFGDNEADLYASENSGKFYFRANEEADQPKTWYDYSATADEFLGVAEADITKAVEELNELELRHCLTGNEPVFPLSSAEHYEYHHSGTNYFYNKSLNITKMQKLTAKVIRTFSKSEKTLFKGGFKDEGRNWTDEAKSQAIEMLCDNKESELVELAEEIIKEEK